MTQRCPSCAAPTASGLTHCPACGLALAATVDPYQTPASSVGQGPVVFDINHVKSKVMPAAIAFLCVSILTFLGYGAALLGGIVEYFEQGWTAEDFMTCTVVVAALILQSVIIAGAIAMLRLRRHTFCFVTSILALFTCCIPQIGIAIWVMVTLQNRMVKDGFALRE